MQAHSMMWQDYRGFALVRYKASFAAKVHRTHPSLRAKLADQGALCVSRCLTLELKVPSLKACRKRCLPAFLYP